MIYKIGMLCKHFKGNDLFEKNIYRIERIGIDGKDIDESVITYTGDGNLLSARNLVVYSNIFQDNKLFAREYDDISSELSLEKQEMYDQKIKVQPLNQMEIDMISGHDFVAKKKEMVLSKYKR